MSKYQQRGGAKSAQAKQQLIATAKVLGPGAKMPTIRRLCQTLGVSVVTLDKIFRQLEQEGVISRRHGSGVFIADDFGQTHIGLVFDEYNFHSSSSTFCSQLIDAIRRRSALLGDQFSLFFNYSQGNASGDICAHDLRRALEEQRLSGIILMGPRQEKLLKFLLDKNIPVTGMSSHPTMPYRVGIDYLDMFRQAAAYVSRLGADSPVILSPFSQEDSRSKQFAEYVEHQTQWDAARIVSPGKTSADPTQVAEDGIDRLKQVPVRFDSILSLDDTMTLGAYRACGPAFAGLPVISHSNESSSILSAFEKRIARLEISVNEIIDSLFELLDMQIHRSTAGGGKTINIRAKLYKPEIIAKQKSTK